MTLYINGEPWECGGAQTLEEALRGRVPTDRRYAVLHNGQVIPADQQATVRLAPEDRVDIVTLAPGG